MKTIVYNGMLIAPGAAPAAGFVIASDGIIEKTGTGAPPETPGAEMIDARGGWIAPGLVDIHTHGFVIMSPDSEQAAEARARSAAFLEKYLK